MKQSSVSAGKMRAGVLSSTGYRSLGNPPVRSNPWAIVEPQQIRLSFQEEGRKWVGPDRCHVRRRREQRLAGSSGAYHEQRYVVEFAGNGGEALALLKSLPTLNQAWRLREPLRIACLTAVDMPDLTNVDPDSFRRVGAV